jgi:hypothetical protein
MKSNQFMLYRSKVAVCSELNTKHTDKYSVGKMYSFWMWNLLARQVTSKL